MIILTNSESRGRLDGLLPCGKNCPSQCTIPRLLSYDRRCSRCPRVSIPWHSYYTSDSTHPISIISITSYSAILSHPESPPNKYGKHLRTVRSGGTWLGFFFKLLLLAGVVAGGYYGWQEYQRRQRYGEFGGGFGGAYGMRTPGASGSFGSYSSKRFWCYMPPIISALYH